MKLENEELITTGIHNVNDRKEEIYFGLNYHHLSRERIHIDEKVRLTYTIFYLNT